MADFIGEYAVSERNILIVDDDDGLRQLIAKCLNKSNFKAYTAGYGAEAVEFLKKYPDTVMLIDQRLPDMDGEAVVKKLFDIGIEVYFVMMTGQGNEQLAVEMMKLGAEDYLVKDVELTDRLPGVFERVFRSIERERLLKKSEIEREKLQSQLIQSQKMEAIGRLAGGIAHDFNNMLSVILSQAELGMLKSLPEDPVYKRFEQIRTAALRSSNLTAQLLSFSRKQPVKPVIVDLNASINSMQGLLKRLIGENISFKWMPGSKKYYIKIDPVQVDQILTNLSANARDAITECGEIVITTDIIDVDRKFCENRPGLEVGEYAVLSVRDSGKGMDQETVSRIFEPFFTTKENGRGTGLGLATVYGIVKQNNGYIEVISELGKGTVIDIYFPAMKNIQTACAELHEYKLEKGNKESVLLVEDEKMIIAITKNMLEELGYGVKAFLNPKEALEYASSPDGRIDLLITDVIMPDMNGRELSDEISKICKGIKTLYMTGYTADVIANHGVIYDGSNFIQKPFSMKQLSEAVVKILKMR